MCTINSKQFDWTHISFSFLGNADVTGVSKIDYKESQDVKTHYGAGNRPVGKSKGARSLEGTIGLYPSAIFQMEKALSDASSGEKTSLLDLPEFDITMQFNNSTDPITTKVIRGVSFKESGLSFGSDSTDIAQEFPFVAYCVENY
jgi:hypothetical protein